MQSKVWFLFWLNIEILPPTVEFGGNKSESDKVKISCDWIWRGFGVKTTLKTLETLWKGQIRAESQLLSTDWH